MSLYCNVFLITKHLQIVFLFFLIQFDLQKSYKTSTQSSQILFTQIPQMLTFYHICFILPLFSPLNLIDYLFAERKS